MLDAVLTNRYDLGIVILKPDDTRLTARTFMQEPLELVVPAGAKVRAWSDLEALGFIDHPDGPAMANRLLSRRFRKNVSMGDLPRNGFSNQFAHILEFVACGLGFTVIPRYARVAFAQQHKIEVMECGSPVVETSWLIHRAEWPLPARCARAVRYLEARMKGQCGKMA
ncbi:substrate-binding domain-containing protein [Caballeronia sp. LZ065]|uniref:substrate-binding domain-containing protein n=1 Tax=Caballeronia sp. LZ065 TaxID=3038571 RepID=UPI00286B1EF0|nr:substrate-binding domain-containing protein [Caballeronia sp. LZ065]